MSAMEIPSHPLDDHERLQLAREAFSHYRTRCFWFMREDLPISQESLPVIVEGLKLYGGHEGWRLAQALCP